MISVKKNKNKTKKLSLLWRHTVRRLLREDVWVKNLLLWVKPSNSDMIHIILHSVWVKISEKIIIAEVRHE